MWGIMQTHRRYSVALACGLVLAVTAIGGCAGGSSKANTSAPSTTSPTSVPLAMTTTSGVGDYGGDLKHGKTTVTVGAKTYELDVFETVDGGDHIHLVWMDHNGTAFNAVYSPDGASFGLVERLEGQQAEGECSMNVSQADANVFEGTFDCPNLSPTYSDGKTPAAASGSFLATP